MTDSASSGSQNRKEIHTYEAPWTTYSLSFSRRPDATGRFKLAVGSFLEEYANEIHVIQIKEDEKGQPGFKKLLKLDHPYPATKIMWAPGNENSTTNELLATTGDYLRVWNVNTENNFGEMKALLNNNKHTEYCAPLTSFDWNEVDTTMLGTCSIDTTVTIWDIVKMQAKTQLIAHDKEVFDIMFNPTSNNILATTGADGSVRLFDLRSLEHSTILYESAGLSPLLRVSWNRLDNNYLATLGTDSNKIVILDVRSPSVPICELNAHTGVCNSVNWAPHSDRHIATCADDRQALIWDIGMTANNQFQVEDPILAYNAQHEVNNMIWCKSHEEWIGITFEKQLQILKI